MALLWLACVFILDTTIGDNSWIDKEYFEKYPYCGQMETENPSTEKTGTGRVVNSKEFTESYRWVVLIKRANLQKDGKIDTTDCSGTVLTERLE